MGETREKLKKSIEEYIEDWHWDEPSKEYAFELGKFLVAFMDYLQELNLSERTLKKHQENVGLIGHFEAGYGYQEEFDPEDLEDGPGYLYEFKTKVSDSKYAIQSYTSTWKKLDKYIKSKTYEKYLGDIERRLGE